MNEQLQQKTIDGIDRIQMWVERTENFVLEQAPLVVQEILKHAILKSALEIVACLLVLIFLYRYSRKLIKYINSSYEFDNNSRTSFKGVTQVMTTLGYFFSIGILLKLSYNLMFIVMCPRLYIIGYLSQLIKNNST